MRHEYVKEVKKRSSGATRTSMTNNEGLRLVNASRWLPATHLNVLTDGDDWGALLSQLNTTQDRNWLVSLLDLLWNGLVDKSIPCFKANHSASDLSVGTCNELQLDYLVMNCSDKDQNIVAKAWVDLTLLKRFLFNLLKTTKATTLFEVKLADAEFDKIGLKIIRTIINSKLTVGNSITTIHTDH